MEQDYRPRFIVIGAGPAGSVAAAGLVKGQEGDVLMLEAGPAEVCVDAMLRSAVGNKPSAWMHDRVHDRSHGLRCFD
jgi:choline dehydrogenase-like flavoprotein